MLSIAHTLTGAYIATKIPDPFIAAPLCLGTHYLLDSIPHWDLGTGLSSGRKTSKQALTSEIPDLMISAVLVILIFQAGKPLTFDLAGLAPYWGAFLGLLPDFLEAPKNFLNREPKILKPLNRFHHSFHNSISSKLAGLIPQAILLVLIYLTK